MHKHDIPKVKARIVSGVQPTGSLHLGNYLGAIRHWAELQQSHQCLLFIADMHAITVPQDPKMLKKNTRQTAAAYIACGIDPDQAVIFPQSAVRAHAELAWILSCHTPLGWLNRMTQFKEKAGKHKDQAVLGLYSYPVLMAADILLYKAGYVPVGEDQKQHLELSRDIAGAFNRAVDAEFFPLPEPLIMGEAARVMSLRDGKKKMSKSDNSEFSRIHLTDDNDVIAQKIRKAKSDMIEGISYDVEARPEVSNLLTIYASMRGITTEAAVELCKTMNFAAFKAELTDALIAHLHPIRERFHHLMDDAAMLNQLLTKGAEKANALAEDTMHPVRDYTGFWQ